MRHTFADWVKESRSQSKDYRINQDGCKWFDLQPGHSEKVPGLRRIQSPEEVSDVFADVMHTASTVAMCAQLIGPDIRFHHGKVNSTVPVTTT